MGRENLKPKDVIKAEDLADSVGTGYELFVQDRSNAIAFVMVNKHTGFRMTLAGEKEQFVKLIAHLQSVVDSL
jgi:hypothetical protein